MRQLAHAQLCGYNSYHKCLLRHSVSGVQEIGNWAMLFKCFLDENEAVTRFTSCIEL